jgi:hypothetical protein
LFPARGSFDVGAALIIEEPAVDPHLPVARELLKEGSLRIEQERGGQE